MVLGREPAALLLRQIPEQLGPMRLVPILSRLVETPDGRSVASQLQAVPPPSTICEEIPRFSNQGSTAACAWGWATPHPIRSRLLDISGWVRLFI